MSVSTIDPDQEWNIAKNPEYGNVSWSSSADGSFEQRVARESKFDVESTGLNYNKIPNQPGEIYGFQEAPLFQYEFDEEEYYNNLTPSKPDEQVEAELDEPRQKMEEKLETSLEAGLDVIWTPALEAMSSSCVLPAARAIEYEISPYFQLNKQGYRKNWANARLCEMRPMMRLQQNLLMVTGDYFFRFQMMRWNLTSKMRMRYWKMVMTAGFAGLMIDHAYARQYKRKKKWH